jgi:hypothetical protein
LISVVVCAVVSAVVSVVVIVWEPLNLTRVGEVLKHQLLLKLIYQLYVRIYRRA